MDKIIQGDALIVLQTLPDQCVQTCVTSPPYWGLRDYGTGTWEGGNPNCNHQMPRNTDRIGFDSKQSTNKASAPDTWTVCGKCGAKRTDRQLGLEQTPEEYVVRMVAIFREVRRVLKDNGTLWLNLGDTYSAQRWTSDSPQRMNGMKDTLRGIAPEKSSGLRDKNLIGIPWRVAFALQADGWILRQDCIWNKPNPMPESVTDRCTKAHEYIFLLSKSPQYYFNNEAIKEPAKRPSEQQVFGGAKARTAQSTGGDPRNGHRTVKNSQWGESYQVPKFSNKRSVWTVATKPYKGAHFATFPPDLIRPCILAGAPPQYTVLDPFMGSGTTALVAKQLHRHYLGIELNPAYIDLARERLGEPRLKDVA